MVYDTQIGPTLTTTIRAHSLSRSDRIIHKGHALTITRHPALNRKRGTVKIKVQLLPQGDHGDVTFPMNASVPIIVGGGTRG